MEKLISMLDDEHVDVATPQVGGRNEYNKLDKEAVKLQLQTRKDLEEVQLELVDKTFEERKQWILDKKAEGNGLFLTKKYPEALKVYLRALMGVSSDLSETESAELDQIKFSILTNMAISAAEMGAPKKSISLLNQAVRITDSPKINYLFATNYFKLQEFELATEYIDKAWDMVQEAGDESRLDFYRQTRDKIHAVHQSHLKKERQMYKNMFGESVPLVPKTPTDAPTRPKSVCERLKDALFGLFARNKGVKAD